MKFKTSFTSYASFGKNLDFWLTQYSMEDILKAVDNIPNHEWWKDKATPAKILRQKSTKGEPVDYIGDLLNMKKKKGETAWDLI